MSAHGRLREALRLLCALVGVATTLGLIATTASADVIHNFLFSFHEVPAEGPAHESVALPGPLLRGEYTLGFDAGRVLVTGADRVDEFDASDGAFLAQPLHGGTYGAIAIGHANGRELLYTTGSTGGGAPTVALYDADGAALGSWSGAQTPAGSLGEGFAGLAVDDSGSLSDWAAGDVYVPVGSQGVVDVFHPEAGGQEKYVTQLTGTPAGPFTSPSYVAVDESNGELAVVDRLSTGKDAVDLFEPTVLGEYAFVRQLSGAPAGPFGTIYGVAFDAGSGGLYSGHLYVADGDTGVVDELGASGEYLGRLTGTPSKPFLETSAGYRTVTGVAVDPTTHDVYTLEEGEEVDAFGPDLVIPDVTTGAATNVAPTEATLNGAVDPDEAGEATCRFAWGTSPALGKVAACTHPVANGSTPVPVQATLTGLQPDVRYYFHLEAANANGVDSGELSAVQSFKTDGPGIQQSSTTEVSATSATFGASIDPDGAPTTYYFQYGTSAVYETEVPLSGASIGSGEGDVEVAQHVQGLQASTTYHYRVVALSELQAGGEETFYGPDQTFTTESVGTLALPDGRQWEMVSPVAKHGSLIEPLRSESGVEQIVQAAAGGDAISYLANAPTESEPQGYDNFTQVLSLRGRSGWESKDLGVPHDTATGTGVGQGEEFRGFSEDLSLAVLQPFGAFTPSLSAEASEQTPFLRSDYLNGNPAEPCESSCYRPLATGKSGYANVPPGTPIGAADGSRCFVCGPFFLGASPNAEHIVVSSEVSLTAGAGRGLYEWNEGKLAFVGTGYSGFEIPGELGSLRVPARHTISDDGSRVIFTGFSEGLEGLLIRDTATGKTVKLDAVQGGSGSGQSKPVFQLASADGTRVLFTDTQQLTADSTANEPNLYECQVVEVAGALRCQLTDLTPSRSGSHGGALAAIGASEDGAWVYFVANEALTPGAVQGECNLGGSAPEATCNLYLWHDGVTTLIAVVSNEDAYEWSQTSSEKAQVSSDGRWLAFMSQLQLSASPVRDASSGKPDEEVYLYDADTGRLSCPSCMPTGALPQGMEYGRLNFEGRPSGFDGLVGTQQWMAASIPSWSQFEGNQPSYHSRALSDSGRLFFNSASALVPQDVDGTWDVYEYEPPGVGDCSDSAATYSPRSGGCVGLLSAGTSPVDSTFLDASASGSDVFFWTESKLSAQDDDGAPDVYDAHECTSASPCQPVPPAQPPACDTGDACKPAPSPQPAIFGAPASSTFTGAGNVQAGTTAAKSAPKVSTRAARARKLARALVACTRKPKSKRKQCKRKARARYAPSSKARAKKGAKR